MDLLSKEEIALITKRCGYNSALSWSFEDLSNEIIGYLGDHLKLNIVVKSNDGDEKLDLRLFVKCMPRFDNWKSKYIEELNFFKKEFIMLSELFMEFTDRMGMQKWRPKLYFIRHDLFVFEDVTKLGYEMPHHQKPMELQGIIATVKTIARFHSDFLIFEENRSKDLGRAYSIWEDYKNYLQEPIKGQSWRDTGRNAVIDFLKEFSTYKTKPDFNKRVETVIPMLFDCAFSLMTPNFAHRNVIVHRDLWTNNIFLKSEEPGICHALIVDFQTVVYSSPMLDLSSFLYFNTTKLFRKAHTTELINIYYETMSKELKSAGLDICKFFDITTLHILYEDSIIFGITQASLILPITAMTREKKQELYCDPKTAVKMNVVSRSKEFIDIARENKLYRARLVELFDEIVERYIYCNDNTSCSPEALINSYKQIETQE